MALSRYAAWALLAVALCDGPAMADAPGGQQERFLLSQKVAEGELIWTFGGDKENPYPWMHPEMVKNFPNGAERNSMNRYQHMQRLCCFFYSVFAFAAVFCLVIEIIARVTKRCCGRNPSEYIPVNQADPKARDHLPSRSGILKHLGDVVLELKGGAANDTTPKCGGGYQMGDMLFAVYMTTYEYFCFGLVAYALYFELIDMDFGLDWELYMPWVAECVIMHLFSTIVSAVIFIRSGSCAEVLRKQPACGIVMFSMMPFISERWNLLRDFITIGIYISQRHWVSYICAGIVVSSLSVVFFKCLQTPPLVRSMRHSYWPLLNVGVTEGNAAVESELGEKVRCLMKKKLTDDNLLRQPRMFQSFVLKQMDEGTREHKRISTIYGDLPQGFAAILYMRFNKFSGFVLVSSLMNLCKAVMLVLLRPLALCYLAGIGEKWISPSGDDISKIMKDKSVRPFLLRPFFGACDWRCLTFNAVEILMHMDEYYQDAVEEAILGLGRLYKKDEGAEQEDQDLIADLVNFLREIKSQQPQLDKPLTEAILNLCPGLKPQDLNNTAVSAGNLGYVPSGVAMKSAVSLVDQMQQGEHDWVKLLEGVNCAPYVQVEGTSLDDLMICYSDLEPDDSMAIAQLWQWNLEHLKMKKDPLIIFGADFTDKDQKTVFEKKALMTQLMVGTRDFYVCTPDQEYYDREKTSGELKDRNHKNHAYWESKRDDNLDEVCTKIADHQGPNVLFYVMAPGRGNLAAIVERLKKMGKWDLMKRKYWKVFLYSGGFNMKGMTVKDLEALKEIAGLARESGNPLYDAAKFPFFGKEDCNPITSSFTTFAPKQFAADLNMVAQPILIALLKLLNDEHNMGLIKPDKIYRKGKEPYGKLEAHERERFRAIEDKFTKDTLQQYCKGIVDDFMLFAKVPDFKKSTIAAFASGCCDSPLCDQLIFVIEFLKKKRPGALKDTETGSWNVNPEKGFTSVDLRSPPSASDTHGTQPVLANNNDMESLEAARQALQDYLLKHLEKFGTSLPMGQARSHR